MARPKHLYVFTYDIEKNMHRRRVAKLLEKHLVRVQLSVYEGWLTKTMAEKLADASNLALGPDDSLRIYCLNEEARKNSLAFGGAPISEAEDYWIV